MDAAEFVAAKTLDAVGCVTVAQLRALVADWPEFDRDGEPTQVWIETGRGRSAPVVGAGPLNLRTDHDGTATADLVLNSALYADRPTAGAE